MTELDCFANQQLLRFSFIAKRISAQHLLLTAIAMYQSFRFTAIFCSAWILFIPEMAFSRPLTTASKYSIVSNSDTDEPVCYMQTVDGRTVNLSSLCGKKISDQFQAEPQAEPQVVISDVSYNGDYLVTHVVNQTGITVHNVRVTYKFIGENSNVIESSSTDTDAQTLKPGQAATLQTFMPRGSQVRSISVRWKD